MGTILVRGERVVVQWVDGSGRKRQRTVKRRRADGSPLSLAARKVEARRKLAELEDLAERQRMGLAPRPLANAGITFGELHAHWEAARGASLRSRAFIDFVRPHVASLFPIAVADVTTSAIDRLLQAKTRSLSEKSVQHIRGHLHGVFEVARVQGGPWEGRPNPVEGSWRPKPRERQVQIITPAEWPALEPHIFERWRPVAKVAFFTGLRRGDVFGLRKADVDLAGGVLTATISKGRKVLRLPIHPELRADLEEALSATPGPFLFAWDRAKRLPNLVKVLRRACGRAGLVAGHELRCRGRACGWSEERGGVAPPPVPDACPRCGRDALYSRPIPRKVRFHDLRHSFGTAIVAAGGTGAGQALLAHSDPRMTQRYTHLAEGLLGGVVARAFEGARAAPGLRPGGAGSARPSESALLQRVARVGPPGIEPGRRLRGGGF
jgi:integrase